MESVAELADADALALAQEVMQPFFDKIDPALVAPVVAYLAHDDCPVTGEIYSVGAGQVSGNRRAICGVFPARSAGNTPQIASA